MDRAAVARREATALGDADGVIFKRFGPAVLWGHWDGSLQWNLEAMPLALRFVILNGTEQDWLETMVELTCPAGWTGQGRQPRHWARPDQMQSGMVRLELGALPKLNRIVAPFWVHGPHQYEMRFPSLDQSMPVFHEPSQPGTGVTLPAKNVDTPEEAIFTVELRAMAADGQHVHRCLTVPVRSVPGLLRPRKASTAA